MLATMVEEPIVIAGVLQWEDGGVNKGVNRLEMSFQSVWQIEIHIGDGGTAQMILHDVRWIYVTTYIFPRTRTSASLSTLRLASLSLSIRLECLRETQ